MGDIIEMKKVMGKMKEGLCWGYFSPTSKECGKCFITSKCDEATKKRQSGEAANGPPEPVAIEKIEPIPDTDPLEYLLKALEGKYDRATQTNDQATADYFKREGKTRVLVVVLKNGKKVKVKWSKGELILDSITSIEHAEQILKDLI